MAVSVELRADLVFEGGGVKGIALGGAFSELGRRGYQPQCVAGTSAGAITASLIAVGYSADEIKDIVLHQMHFPKFADPSFLGHLGVVGEGLEFLLHRGMHSGTYFVNWLTELLVAKGKTTFGDLRDDTATDENRRYRLQVIASDLSKRTMLILPRDAADIGIANPDDLEIATAVRMSMSIPIFFEPVVFNDHVIVDGGMLSNYPVWLFDTPADKPPEFPTFGMALVAPGQDAPILPPISKGTGLPDVNSDIEFLKVIVETMTQAHDRFYIEQANFARTIPIPTLGVKTTQFDITPEQAQALFDSGQKAAADFLDAWDLDAYKAKFRSATPPPSRGDTLTQ